MASKILILDTMLQQAKETPDIFQRVNRGLGYLESYTQQGHPVLDYMVKHNGKKMKNAEHVWKYRLTRGERILYTYGRYVAGVREEDAGCIVLLAYSKHDDQMETAQNLVLNDPHETSQLTTLDPLDLPTETEEYIIEDISATFDNQHQHHRLLIAPDSDLKQIDASELDVYLSDEQYSCIEAYRNSPQPTLVLGGAGTGKSMIALHVLVDYAEKYIYDEKHPIAYFTQSEELRRNSSMRFRNISQWDDLSCISFQGIENFCMDALEYSKQKRKGFVNQDRFIREFPDFYHTHATSKLQNTAGDLDWVMVWTEIRGVIKGQLDENWHRCAGYPQSNLGRSASYLEKEGWIKRDSEDKKLIYPASTVSELKKRAKSSPPHHGLSELSEMIRYFESIDLGMSSMGEKAYLSLDDEASTVQSQDDSRAIIWQIYLLYQDYLQQYHLFDCNDLVIQALKRQTSLKTYELVVVDEVQDYTELQIYLTHKLCRSHNNILFVGDGNQNVNPTLFRTDHLRRLYRGTQHELKEITLHKNYRSPDSVIRATNALADLRSKTIATQHQSQELPETAIRIGTPPYRLVYTTENLLETLKSLSSYPSTALLVPDMATKAKLCEMFKPYQKQNATPFIFTVSEIKGMEYKYVVCYNLISRYHSTWSDMLSREKKSHQTGERYYFNLLYVAMTRSQQHLGFMDEKTIVPLEETLGLKSIANWDVDLLHYTDMQDTPAGWMLQAKQSEEQGRYEDAILFYRRANAEDTFMYRCEAKLALEQSKYQEAFVMALQSGDDELIKETSQWLSDEEVNDEASIQELCHFFSDRYSDADDIALRLPSIIAECFGDMSPKELKRVSSACQRQLDDLIIDKINNLETWVYERM